MKSTGIVREIDTVGRITIPMEIREQLEIKKRTEMSIYVNKGCIILEKYNTNCTFCGSDESLYEYKGHKICNECVKKIKNVKE